MIEAIRNAGPTSLPVAEHQSHLRRFDHVADNHHFRTGYLHLARPIRRNGQGSTKLDAHLPAQWRPLEAPPNLHDAPLLPAGQLDTAVLDTAHLAAPRSWWPAVAKPNAIANAKPTSDAKPTPDANAQSKSNAKSNAKPRAQPHADIEPTVVAGVIWLYGMSNAVVGKRQRTAASVVARPFRIESSRPTSLAEAHHRRVKLIEIVGARRPHG
ncbi:MAG: hypothetical protein R3E01_02760 [Pirellulaceae bacterium]